MDDQLTTQYVQDRMGSGASDAEAFAMCDILSEQRITTEEQVDDMDDALWFNLMVEAVRRSPEYK